MKFVNPKNINSAKIDKVPSFDKWIIYLYLLDEDYLAITKETKEECVELAEKLGLILID